MSRTLAATACAGCGDGPSNADLDEELQLSSRHESARDRESGGRETRARQPTAVARTRPQTRGAGDGSMTCCGTSAMRCACSDRVPASPASPSRPSPSASALNATVFTVTNAVLFKGFPSVVRERPHRCTSIAARRRAGAVSRILISRIGGPRRRRLRGHGDCQRSGFDAQR